MKDITSLDKWNIGHYAFFLATVACISAGIQHCNVNHLEDEVANNRSETMKNRSETMKNREETIKNREEVIKNREEVINSRSQIEQMIRDMNNANNIRSEQERSE